MKRPWLVAAARPPEPIADMKPWTFSSAARICHRGLLVSHHRLERRALRRLGGAAKLVLVLAGNEALGHHLPEHHGAHEHEEAEHQAAGRRAMTQARVRS